MAELCLVASHGYPLGPDFYQEQSVSRVSKEYRPIFPNYGSRQTILRSSSLNEYLLQNDELWSPKSGLSKVDRLVRIDSNFRRTILIDMQDGRSSSILFSFRIAEQCWKQEKVLNFLTSGSSEAEKSGLDLSLVYNLMGLNAFAAYAPQQTFSLDHELCSHDTHSNSSLVYPSSEDLLGNLTNRSNITIYPDGQVLVPGVVSEMDDVFSVISEIFFSRNSTKWRKQLTLVPSFHWLDGQEATVINASSLNLETLKVSPLKSPDKIKLKSSTKKKSNRRSSKEKDFYRNNYVHACESLLSIVVDKKRHAKTAILSLKKSSPELPQLLNQMSASIAGAGLAVLFSVMYTLASGRVAFCSSKILSAGLGVGLVWLSWAVSRLRDTIIQIRKSSGKSTKLGTDEEEMMRDLDRNVDEIYFRFVALLAVAVLRFV